MQRELQGSEINEYKSFQYFMNEFLLINLKFFLIFAAVMKFLEQKIGFLKTKNICPRRKKKPTYRLDNFILWHTSPSLSFHKNQT